MNKNAAVVLNNIGGGINVWVERLPSVGESVMGFGFDVPMDLAKGGNVAVALQRLGVPTAIVGKLGCDAAGERDTQWLLDARRRLRSSAALPRGAHRPGVWE